jgi:hypothetical protein
MKIKLAYLILIAALFSCVEQPVQSKNKINDFWNWFKNNKTAFDHIDDENRDAKLDSILSHLNLVKSGLAVEVSDEFKGVRDIIISANSDIEKFNIVKEIVKRAPVMKGWTVTAFRQRANQDFNLKYKNLSFVPSKMLFYPEEENGKLKIQVYVKGIANYNYDTVSYYGSIAMDNVLGEYNSVTKIAKYSFHELDSKHDANLKPVIELPAFIDKYYKTN